MKHTPENCKDKILVDAKGEAIPGVMSFDDVTNEVELVLMGETGSVIVSNKNHIPQVTYEFGPYDPVILKFVLLGAKLVDKPT